MIRLTFLLLFISICSYSQNTVDESEYLLIGTIYQEQINNDIIGHIFWDKPEYQKGSIIYKDVEFTNKRLKYDLLNQKLILYQDINHQLPRFIQLNTHYISTFKINNQLFSNKDNFLKELPSEYKFLNVILQGKITYLIGRKKILHKLAVKNEYDKYDLIEEHFLLINNEVFVVKNKRDLYKIFNPYKKQLKMYIKKNKLRIDFKNNRNDVKLLLEFCETLI